MKTSQIAIIAVIALAGAGGGAWYLWSNFLCSDEAFGGRPEEPEESAARLYADGRRCGGHLTIRHGEDVEDLHGARSDEGRGGFGDEIESAQWAIAEGWRLVLYEDTDFKGESYALDGDGVRRMVDDIGALADEVSSARWERVGAGEVDAPEGSWVRLYDDDHFRDRRLTIAFREDLSDLHDVSTDDGEQGFNDKASSVRWQIARGWRVTLYDDTRFRDRAHVLEGDGEPGETTFLGDFNDKASSLRWERTEDDDETVGRIEDALVHLYDDTGFADRRVTLKGLEDVEDLHDVASDDGQRGFNDKTSSVQWLVPTGWIVALYDDHDHRDRRRAFEGTGRLEQERSLAGFDDKTSSVRWERALIASTDHAFVELFDDSGYRDRKLTIPFGTDVESMHDVRTDDGEGGFNDKTSAARWIVPGGWAFVLYDDDRYKDRRFVLKGTGRFEGRSSLPDFGDKASAGRWERTSIRSTDEAVVELYDDSGFEDRRLTVRFRENHPDFHDVRTDDGQRGFNDKTSAARWTIPDGWAFVLYDDTGFEDRTRVLQGTGSFAQDSHLGGFNDKASSGRWERR